MIEDITGKKEVKAIEVFKHAIKYFKDLMLTTIDKKGLGVKEEYWTTRHPSNSAQGKLGTR